MNVLMMADTLLQGTNLSPAQLSELRAINTMYYVDAEASRSVETVVSRLREMLRPDQREVLDRNLAAWRTRHDGDDSTRVREE